MPSYCLILAMHYGELAANAATPLSRFAGLPPRESVSLGSQVALLPYEPSSLATLFRGRIGLSMLPCRIICGTLPTTKGGPLFHRLPGRLFGFIIMAPLHFQRAPTKAES